MKCKLYIIVVAALLLSACKTTRTLPKVVLSSTTAASQTIEQVQKAQPQFNTANVSKMALELVMNERKVNVSATCKIRKDSAIFLSVQPFMGIELFRAELMPDSMRVFDKMNRKYYVTDYSYFTKRFGVEIDFYSFQALIFNQFFCVGTQTVLPDSCKLIALLAGRTEINYETEKMLQSTEITAVNTIDKVLLKAKGSSYQLQTNYDNFSLMNGINFPQQIALKASNEKSNASCVFSILKVDFNTSLKFAAASTDRYSRGDIDQLLKK